MSEWKHLGSDTLISSRGQVMRKGVIVAPHITDKGYCKIAHNGKFVSVHRLVAQAFIPNENNLPEVNHKDGNKLNNASENLEWCTRSQNMKHAYAAGLHPGVRLCGTQSPNFGRSGAKHQQSMPVRAIFADGTTRDYASQGLAAKDGFSPHKISMCIQGHRKTHRGAAWMPLPTPPKEAEHPTPNPGSEG